MRRLELNSWSWRRVAAAATALAAGVTTSAAFAAGQTLTELNSGPSAQTIPTANNEPALTLRYPREVVDTTVVGPNVPLPANLNNNGLSIEQSGSTTTGIRWRSRSVLQTINFNANAEFAIVGNPGFDGDASESYIAFLPWATAQNITTLAELEAVVGAGSAAGAGTGYSKYLLSNAGFGPLADGDVEAADFNTGNGVAITLAALNAATPDAGNTTVGAWQNFEVAIIVIEDVAGGNQTTDLVTEWICVRNPTVLVEPSAAATSVNGGGDITAITIATNLQLQDDAAADNPADTGALAVADFRVRPGGAGPVQLLSTWLAGFTGPPVAGVITITGSSDSDFTKIITIPLTTPILAADAATAMQATIGFAASSNVFGVSGENPSSLPASYKTLGLAAPLTVTSVNLLQGNGPVVGQGVNQIWAEINFSDSVTAVGDNNQFQLEDADGNVIATSNLVQSAVPSNVQVPGIDDTNLDGTTSDPVTAAAANRVFARFTLADGDDAINSDGTWSNDGSDDYRLRETRSAINLVANPGGGITYASNILGGTLDPATESTMGDKARPMAVAFEARSAGNISGVSNPLCALIDQIAVVFDETVSGPTSNRFASGYNAGVTINDLSAGLAAGLTLRTAETAAAANFAARVFAAPSATTLATSFESNDTVTFTASLLPLTADAADGTLAATGIRSGTGFPGGSPYFVALNNVAVTDGTLGNTLSPTATFTTNVLTAYGTPVNVVDAAAPALVGANGIATGGSGDLDEVTAGFSEPLFKNGANSTTEGESYFVISENNASARRHAIDGSFVGAPVANRMVIDLSGEELDEAMSLTPGFNVNVFNPGFPLEDANGNQIDPIKAKDSTRSILITAPSGTFKDRAVAELDEASNRVTLVRLKTTRQVEIVGSATSLLERFYVRGADVDGGGNPIVSGQKLSLAGLLASIDTPGTTPDDDGCYTLIIRFPSGMLFPQDNFTVEYAAPADQTAPSGVFLREVGGSAQNIPSTTGDHITVRVIRPQETSPQGNPLTMTFTGTLRLGASGNASNDALGSMIKAFVLKPVGEEGTIQFFYKGIRYVGTVTGWTSGDGNLFGANSVRYFHPQLIGQGGPLDSESFLQPQGILNTIPDLQLYASTELASGNNPNNNREVLIYQNLNSLSNVVQPIRITFNPVTNDPSRFTGTGTGISDCTITFKPRFEEIGRVVVTGTADGTTNARRWTMHTAGHKDFKGCPVIFVVIPDPDIAGGRAFLANNAVARRVAFLSDIDRRGSGTGSTATAGNAAPVNFNIDRDQIGMFQVSSLLLDSWAGMPLDRTNNGQDFLGAGVSPNRLQVPGTGSTFVNANTSVSLPVGGGTTGTSSTNASGFFIFVDDDEFDSEPVCVSVDTALAIDSAGVYCGSLRGLNRIVAGYSVFLEFGGGVSSSYYYNTFGPRISSLTGPARLIVTNSAQNGGWTTLTNFRNASVTANDMPGTIAIAMGSSTGVLIGGEDVPTGVGDLGSVDASEAAIVFVRPGNSATFSAQ
ncbi:MAG: hypothetical protein AB7G17_07735 [Phycisphaerales bacterium]